MTGAELKVLRVRLGVTRRELGDAIGVDPVTVWRWETGKTNNSRTPVPGRELFTPAGVPSAAVEWLLRAEVERIRDLERWKLYRETDGGGSLGVM